MNISHKFINLVSLPQFAIAILAEHSMRYATKARASVYAKRATVAAGVTTALQVFGDTLLSDPANVILKDPSTRYVTLTADAVVSVDTRERSAISVVLGSICFRIVNPATVNALAATETHVMTRGNVIVNIILTANSVINAGKDFTFSRVVKVICFIVLCIK